VLAIAEQAPAARVSHFVSALWRHPAKVVQAARWRASLAGTPYRAGTWVVRADGAERVERVTLTDGRSTREIACDFLACGWALVPSIELACLLGCDTAGGRVVVDAVQRTSVPGVLCAGEPTGVAGEDAALVQGEIAGLAAAGDERGANAASLQHARREWQHFAELLAEAFDPRTEVRALADDATIVCRCEDVARGALHPAWSARQAKLYTRLSMGPCQGAVCGAACDALWGWAPNDPREPVVPVAVGVIAGGAGGAGLGTRELGLGK
jgi:NAD(P)H-nitrite reductase large subunit